MKKFILISTLFTFYFSLSTFNSNAQWQLTSLDANSIGAIAVSGNNVFAGSAHGVFLSTDNGNSWTQENTGLTDTIIGALAISGNNTFAGTWYGGVFLSSDNGQHWSAANMGLPDSTDITSFVISGNNIYAGTYNKGIFLSIDNGQHWTAINTGLTCLKVMALAISGNNIFAGTYYSGVFLSSNNGQQWTAVNTGMPDSTYITSLAVSGNNIFAGSRNRKYMLNPSDNVFLSSNNGQQWTAVNTGLSQSMGVDALIPIGNYILVGTVDEGVYSSSNNGSSWDSAGTGYNEIDAFAVNGSYIFAGKQGESPNDLFRLPLSQLGIDEINNNAGSIKVYPSPATNNITIDAGDLRFTNLDLRIYDVVGNLVLEKNAYINKTNIDVSAFPNGVYFVKVRTEKGMAVEKFVKE